MKEAKKDLKEVKNGQDHRTELEKEKAKEMEMIKANLSKSEMDVVTTVFRSYETGLREATILPKDLLAAMKMLGLNPMEQEVVDLTNNIVKDGFIYFPEFCKTILKKFREEDEEVFSQDMFKVVYFSLNIKNLFLVVFPS